MIDDKSSTSPSLSVAYDIPICPEQLDKISSSFQQISSTIFLFPSPMKRQIVLPITIIN